MASSVRPPDETQNPWPSPALVCNSRCHMGGAPTVLIVVNDDAIGNEIAGAASRRGYFTIVVPDIESARDRGLIAAAQVVLLVLPLLDVSGRESIERLRAFDSSLPVIVLGVDPTLRTAEQAARLGVREHLLNRPFKASEILAALGGVLGSRQGDRTLELFRSAEARQATWETVIGESTVSRNLVALLRQLCARGGAP